MNSPEKNIQAPGKKALYQKRTLLYRKGTAFFADNDKILKISACDKWYIIGTTTHTTIARLKTPLYAEELFYHCLAQHHPA